MTTLTAEQAHFKTWDPYSFTVDDPMYTPWPPKWCIHYYYDSFALESKFFDTQEEAQDFLLGLDKDGIPARLYSPEFILDSIIDNFLDDCDIVEDYHE